MIVPAWVRGTLVLAATLAAGVAIGVGYERRREPEHGAAGVGSHHVLRHFQRELGLDSAQERAIAAIIARRQGAVDSTWHAMRPHVRATMDSAHREIVSVLRPDQAAKYRMMVGAVHREF